MRICQITSMHDWSDDRIYQRACEGLARSGHEVFLVATEGDKKPDATTAVKFIWLKRRKGVRRRLLSSREAVLRAISLNADIYHFHDPDLLPFIGMIKRRKPSSKVVYDIHENYAGRFQMWGVPKVISSLLSKSFRNFELRTINNIDGYTVVSESMKKIFEKAQKPGVIIRNSTDIERLRNIEFETNKNTAAVGRIIYTSGTNSPERNCLQTLQALPEILAYHPEARMVFAGRYTSGIKERLMQWAQHNNVSAQVKLDGMLPWEENFHRTINAFCGCVFYADNPNNRVGIPNRLFEYMYCGIPILVSDFPELRKIVEDTGCGIIVDSENPKGIAAGVKRLLDDPVEASAMGKRGKDAIIDKYGFHIDLKRMIDFYEEILH